MSELARAEDWDSCERTEDPLLETTTRFLVASLFLHNGASQSQLGYLSKTYFHLIQLKSSFYFIS